MPATYYSMNASHVMGAIGIPSVLLPNMRWQSSSRMGLLALGMSVLPLLACSGSGATADSQVVATVNGAKLTAAQLTQAQRVSFLDGQENLNPVDALIDEELLAQEAHKVQLDSEDAVQQEIERARRKILSEAYVAREIAPQVTVSTDEMRAFYDRYPALFKQRRIFEFMEFSIATTSLTDQLRAEIAQVRSADELRNKLNRYAVKFFASKQAMSAEQLPMDRMTDLAKMTVGDVLLVPQDIAVTRLLAVTAIAEDPQPFVQVQPRIEQYLLNSRTHQLVIDRLKLARATATIAVPHGAPAVNDKRIQLAAEGPGNGAFPLDVVSRAEATHAGP